MAMTTMKRDRKLFTDDCTTTIEYPPHTTTYRDPVEAFVAGVIKGALAVIDDAFGGDSPHSGMASRDLLESTALLNPCGSSLVPPRSSLPKVDDVTGAHPPNTAFGTDCDLFESSSHTNPLSAQWTVIPRGRTVIIWTRKFIHYCHPLFHF